MPMSKNEKMTLAGLHVTIGFALAHDRSIDFCCPIDSECGQFKYCSNCDVLNKGLPESEKHNARWWMNELKKYEDYMRDGRDNENC